MFLSGGASRGWHLGKDRADQTQLRALVGTRAQATESGCGDTDVLRDSAEGAAAGGTARVGAAAGRGREVWGTDARWE